MSTYAILNQSEPNWTEPQTPLASQNNAFSVKLWLQFQLHYD